MATAARAQEAPTIAVVDFGVRFPHEGDAALSLAKIGADVLADMLTQTGRFEVLERDKLARLVEEQDFGQSGIVEAGSAQRFGLLAGAKLVAMGDILELGAQTKKFSGYGVEITNQVVQLTVSVKVVSVERGSIFFSARESSAHQTQSAGHTTQTLGELGVNALLEDALGRVVAKLVDKMSAPAAAEAVSSEKVSVRIQSTPAGADIELDGAFVGNTPATLKIPEGLRVIRISRQGYRDWRKRVSVVDGMNINAQLAKEKEEKPQPVSGGAPAANVNINFGTPGKDGGP